jgi:hypothetical protein
MSLETWKQEFYPISAEEIVENGASTKELIEHSLRKWKGLREFNLQKHNIGRSPISRDIGISGADYLSITNTTCALCKKFLFRCVKKCHNCPLFIISDSQSCDEYPEDEGPDIRMSPYFHWSSNNDPEPMIALLEKALTKDWSES